MDATALDGNRIASRTIVTGDLSIRGPRRGFYWQDWYAAWIMLRCWAEPRDAITAVEVEAVAAPHVDDIVIHRRHRTVFKQLKHKSAGTFTGADLFSPAKDEAALIGKLFLGWQRVRTAYGSEVEVHLTTNGSPSRSTNNYLISPARFQEAILAPARSAILTHHPDLAPIYDRLLSLTGAPDLATLQDFLSALRLEFEQPDAHTLQQQVIAILKEHLRPAATAETEAKAWLERVYDLSTRSPASGPLSWRDIDHELRQLFHVHRHPEHRLALPEHHVPRTAVAADVLAAAHQVGTGYLLVLGPPGCGKTTLATWIANNNDDRLLLRYHVFDPQFASALERRGRASAQEFLSTIFDVLRERFPGIAPPYVPADSTQSSAIAALRTELERLAGDRTHYLLVDGIDHVVRVGLGLLAWRGSLNDEDLKVALALCSVRGNVRETPSAFLV